MCVISVHSYIFEDAENFEMQLMYNIVETLLVFSNRIR